MDGMADDDLAGELLDLTRQLRGQLLRHAALGAWAAPGGASARIASSDVLAEPGSVRSDDAVSSDASPSAGLASAGLPSAGSPVRPLYRGDDDDADDAMLAAIDADRGARRPGDDLERGAIPTVAAKAIEPAPIALGRRTL